jgi:hypothetical protein
MATDVNNHPFSLGPQDDVTAIRSRVIGDSGERDLGANPKRSPLMPDDAVHPMPPGEEADGDHWVLTVGAPHPMLQQGAGPILSNGILHGYSETGGMWMTLVVPQVNQNDLRLFHNAEFPLAFTNLPPFGYVLHIQHRIMFELAIAPQDWENRTHIVPNGSATMLLMLADSDGVLHGFRRLSLPAEFVAAMADAHNRALTVQRFTFEGFLTGIEAYHNATPNARVGFRKAPIRVMLSSPRDASHSEVGSDAKRVPRDPSPELMQAVSDLLNQHWDPRPKAKRRAILQAMWRAVGKEAFVRVNQNPHKLFLISLLIARDLGLDTLERILQSGESK